MHDAPPAAPTTVTEPPDYVEVGAVPRVTVLRKPGHWNPFDTIKLALGVHPVRVEPPETTLDEVSALHLALLLIDGVRHSWPSTDDRQFRVRAARELLVPLFTSDKEPF